ncbi:probable galacturonosyltransferase 7 isoform X1 [Tanacetum coccineum]
MKDQLYVSRAYYPSIAKMPKLDQFSQEMKQNIQEYERVLAESSSDPELPLQLRKEAAKLRQQADLTEDEANFHMKQSAFLYQLAVQTTSKSPFPELHHYVQFSNNVLCFFSSNYSTIMHAIVHSFILY